MNYGFGISEEDVANVLRNNWKRVGNTEGKDFDLMGEELFSRIDTNLVEKAALDASTEMEEQTNAAYEEIERQLVEQGVLEPVRNAPRP